MLVTLAAHNHKKDKCMVSTKLLYLEQNFLYKVSAQVLAITERDDKKALVLDQTIFYPQGGGQPADHGEIICPQGRFAVTDVRFVEGVVYHFGSFTQGSCSVGDNVELQIDVPRRELLSRLHTAGHLVDVAMERIGLQLMPTKAYHFPDNPYVEYQGVLTPEQCADVQQKLQTAVDALIKEDLPVTHRLAHKDELAAICSHVPEHFPEGKPVRVVTISNFAACPCGGTHVASSTQLGKLEIRKIKSKGGVVRVSYLLAT